MATEYEWEIISLYTEPSKDGLSNIVKKINWRYQATDGANYGDVYGTTLLPEVSDPSSFTAYESLSEDTFVSWIKAHDDFDDIKAKVDAKLANHKAPAVVEKAPPWDKSSTYTGDEEYLLVWDNEPNDNEKIWGPFKWASARANKGLKERGVTDFTFQDDIIMYRKGLIPTDAPLTINSNVKLWKVDYQEVRTYDARWEYQDPQTWDLSNGKHAVRTFVVNDKSVSDIKTQLHSDLSNISFNKQISGTTITVKGKSVKAATTFVAQTALFQKWSLMADSATASCKLNESEWFTLTKSELKAVIDSIASNLQTILDEEKSISDKINAATTVDQLKAIEMMTLEDGE